LALVPAEVATKSLVDALIEQNPHQRGASKDSFASSNARNASSRLKVVEQRAHQDPRTSKNRRPGHRSGIANDN